jgi:hypothetical protein
MPDTPSNADKRPSPNLPEQASIPDLRLIIPDHAPLPHPLITDLTTNPPSGTLIEP